MYLADWDKTMRETGDVVDDLVEVMEQLRKGKHYAEADRVRTLAGRLARAIPPYPRFGTLETSLIRTIARSYK